MKDGVGTVGIEVDLDPRAHEMRPHRALRDLQFQRPVGDAIVVSDLALLLNAQDLAEIDALNRDEGRAGRSGLNREAGVVLRQIDVADEGVGRLDVSYAGELEFVRQTILQRAEHPLRTAPRLGRIGPDMLDAQLRERPADLGWMAAVDRAAGLGGEKVMGAAVGVEAHRQAVLGKDLVQRPQGRGRAFLLDEKDRKSTRLNSSHPSISYAVFCLKKKI